MRRERGHRRRLGIDEPVGRGPAPDPPSRARAERAPEVRVRVEQVARRPDGRVGIGGEERREQRQVVLGLVDRVGGFSGAGQPSRAAAARSARFARSSKPGSRPSAARSTSSA
jgi:hypothetical protein